MSKYYCVACNYDAKVKGNYEKHLRTKKHQKSTESHQLVTIDSIDCKDVSENVKTFQCKYCCKIFKHKQGMYRHIKYTCKKNEDEDLKELARLLNEQLLEKNIQIERIQKTMQKQIEKLTNKLQIQNINNQIINNVQNIQNNTINIKLLNYTDTDYSHLTHKDYISCIKECNHCVKTLIEKVHFNKDKPENMNIYISNIKGNYIMVYKDNEWQIERCKNKIDDLYDNNELVLENWFDEYKEKYPHIIKSFKRYLNNRDESDEMLNSVKNDILLMLYNNRKSVSIVE